MELMREYVADQSESAFTALVSRHTNLVYSTALRRVGDPQLAEEITQAVFSILAQKADSLGKGTILSGWLYRATCYVSGHACKQELRRRRREQEAYMQSLSDTTESELWLQITPLLEEAMLRLGRTDRDALVLRFFEGHSVKEVGAVLGTSEAATKMRLSRAVEKLRAYFFKHGVTSTTTAIAGAISVNSIQAAPVALAKTATAVALAKVSAASASTSILIKGGLRILAWAKVKSVAVSALVLGGLAVTPLVVHHYQEIHNDTSSEHWSKNLLANQGYRTPEAALQTLLWAMTHADYSACMASATPEQRARMEKDLKNDPRETFAARMEKKFTPVTGFRITGRRTISRDTVEIDFDVEGVHKADKCIFKKIGDEWKFDQ